MLRVIVGVWCLIGGVSGVGVVVFRSMYELIRSRHNSGISIQHKTKQKRKDGLKILFYV